MSESQLQSSQNKSKKIKKINPKQSHNEGGLHKGMTGQSDARFSRAQYDPKFMAPSSKVTKVKIDKRFSKMLSDSSFNANSSIDRYGRVMDKNKVNNQLKEYYYMENEDGQDNAIQDKSAHESGIAQDESAGNEGIRQWMQNYNEQSSEELGDIDYDNIGKNYADIVWSDQSQHVIKGQNVSVTNRLALCNYDWMNITSKDLMILFNSFKPKTGYIKTIKVYMSNIGKQKLSQQEKHGPLGLWKKNETHNNSEQNSDKKKSWRKSWKELLQERLENDNDGFDQMKLRSYQKERLKYFYAVIECDSKKTADEIYKECDQNQFQSSNIQFDLRFIPDDLQFDLKNLKQECNDLPMGGEIKNFITRALGHSKVNLSWQDPELSLTASLKKKNWSRLSEEQLQKIDWGMYIDQHQIEEEDQMKQLVQQNVKEEDVISDWRKSCNKKYRKNDDIQINFEGGFDTKNKKVQKVEQKVQSLNKQKKSMKQRRREHFQEKKKQREKLELLVDDKKHPEVKVNLDDGRFKAVYDNPIYAIDPVDPLFDHRRTGQVFAEVVKRNKGKNRE